MTLPSFVEEDETIGASSEAAQQQRLVVLRHSSTLSPSAPRYIDCVNKRPWDVPLASNHATGCVSKAEKLPDIAFGVVAISPFTCCTETAAAVLPGMNLSPDVKIFMHRGLSELHSMQHMFPRQSAPTIAQRFALWRWRSKRDVVPPEFATLAGVQVQKHVLGEWPTLPEDSNHAGGRFASAVKELLELAGGRSVLLITHADGVENVIHMARPGATIKSVDYLGHAEIARTLPDGSHLKQPSPWHLVEPSPYGESRCGVDLVSELMSSHERDTSLSAASSSSKWTNDRHRMDEALQNERLALESNPWWAMTDGA
ncbi:hypothetical protein FOA52_000037 [Chlamydomonas sp. UWO 241]|nr:hypothetical protein FOA52_000037 [Chlamydomonas sp. UWO 241]